MGSESKDSCALVEDTQHIDENKAHAIVKKHGIEFIKLSEVKLLPHIVRLLPQSIVTEQSSF